MVDGRAAKLTEEVMPDTPQRGPHNTKPRSCAGGAGRIWVLDCDPNCPGGILFEEPHTCEFCGTKATEYARAGGAPGVDGEMLRAFYDEAVSCLEQRNAEIERLREMYRVSDAENDEMRDEIEQLRAALRKIAGHAEYTSEDHRTASNYKPEKGLWTTDEYLADSALGLHGRLKPAPPLRLRQR